MVVITLLPTFHCAANGQIGHKYVGIDRKLLDPYKHRQVFIHKIPADRDMAELWLVYLTDMEYSSLSPEMAKSWAECFVAEPQELTDGELKRLFLNAKRSEFKRLNPKVLHGKIRHAVAKRDARRKAARDHLFKAAKELAEVARKHRGTDEAKIAEAALKATGYVDHEGKVMPWLEASPFGYAR